MIAIIDYGVGNAGSVMNMLAYLGIKALITSDAEIISESEKLILTGVGSFDTGIGNLTSSGLQDVIQRKVIDEKAPVLGICLGMQLMGSLSEEGKLEGLNWIDASAVRFDSSMVRTPHMSWNYLKFTKESRLFHGFDAEPRFYFAHSYYMVAGNAAIVSATSDYGGEFVAAIEQDNIAGVQFHPEKSHKFGMKLLRNFSNNY